MLMCVFAHSFFIENPPVGSWEITPAFLGGFCHSWHQSKIGVKHTEASKNLNNVVSEERLAHIRIIVVFLGGKLTYVFFYATTEMHQ
jgi:prolipoprotein diacylglyceryltransferase